MTISKKQREALAKARAAKQQYKEDEQRRIDIANGRHKWTFDPYRLSSKTEAEYQKLRQDAIKTIGGGPWIDKFGDFWKDDEDIDGSREKRRRAIRQSAPSPEEHEQAGGPAATGPSQEGTTDDSEDYGNEDSDIYWSHDEDYSESELTTGQGKKELRQNIKREDWPTSYLRSTASWED